MGAVALVLLGALVLGAVVLAAPVTLRVDLRRPGPGERLRARVALGALFGLVDTELGRGPRPHRPRPSRRRRRGWTRWTEALWDEDFRAAVERLAARLWRAVRVRELRGWVQVGFDDPADTGLAWAVLGPVAERSERRWPHFHAAPTFEGPALDADLHGAVAVVPLELLGVAVAFLLTPATLRGLSAVRRPR